MKCILTLGFGLFLHFSISAQSQPQFRLKSLVREDFTQKMQWITADSVQYNYPSNHTGIIDWRWAENLSFERIPWYSLWRMYPSLGYDSAVFFQFLDTKKTLKGRNATYQQLDVNGKIVNFKTVTYNPATNVKTSDITTSYVYQGNNLIELSTKDYKYSYKYKNGMLDSILVFNSFGGKTTKRTVYFYTANGLLAREIGLNVDNASDSFIKDYTYDGNGRMIEMLRHGKMYSNTPYDTFEVQKYQFSSSGDLIVQESFMNDIPFMGGNTTILIPWDKRIHTYDQNHNKLETVTYVNNDSIAGLDLFSKRTYSYDNNGLLTKLEMLNWNGNQYMPWPDTNNEFGGSHIIHFNYEMFWPTGVNEVRKNVTDVKIYPSPASDFIRVETSWKEAKPFVATITDMQGRIVRKWEEPATKVYIRTIPLTELQSGAYILKMSCSDEEVAKQFTLYK